MISEHWHDMLVQEVSTSKIRECFAYSSKIKKLRLVYKLQTLLLKRLKKTHKILISDLRTLRFCYSSKKLRLVKKLQRLNIKKYIIY